MQYLYHPDASMAVLELSGDRHRYLFKVRRYKAGEVVYLRNLHDGILYGYRIISIDKRSARLRLETEQKLELSARKALHLGWCMIDPKSIEKMLPSLNETGVSRVTFIYCQRSQKSFRPDFKRWEKILLSSSQQCGRSVMMELEMMASLEAFIEKYPQAVLLHFSEQILENQSEHDTIVIGCEGGFSEEEVALFAPSKIVGLDTPLILRSESAAIAAAARQLL